MKIKKGFVLEKVGESYLACATGKLAREFSGLVKLNETGAFIWGLFANGDITLEVAADKMIAEYDISREIALRDIEAFAVNLKKNGILE
ncbi:MAG: PqqD family protein [Clostridia bacterium]|nr:PqqD family protein [Clostridia bacterium]